MKIRLWLLIMPLSLLATSFWPAPALAASSGAFSLQVSDNHIYVYETSSVAVNTADAELSYSGLTGVASIGVAAAGTFATCPGLTNTSIACSILGGSVTGTHLLATLTINLAAGAQTASATVHVTDSSMLLASSDNTDTLNHASLPSATYTYTAPAPQPNPAPSPRPTPSSSASGSASNPPKSASTPASAASPTPAASTAAKGSSLGDTTAQPVTTAAVVVKESAQTNWLKVAGLIAALPTFVILAFAGYYWFAQHYTVSFHIAAKPTKSR